MPFEPYPFWFKNPRKGRIPDRVRAPDPGDESKTIATASRRSPRPKVLEVGPFGADIGSFALHLAAGGEGTVDDSELHRGGALVRRGAPAAPDV